jgi:hypothetical protein
MRRELAAGQRKSTRFSLGGSRLSLVFPSGSAGEAFLRALGCRRSCVAGADCRSDRGES